MNVKKTEGPKDVHATKTWTFSNESAKTDVKQLPWTDIVVNLSTSPGIVVKLLISTEIVAKLSKATETFVEPLLQCIEELVKLWIVYLGTMEMSENY